MDVFEKPCLTKLGLLPILSALEACCVQEIMDSNGDYKEDNSNGSQGGGHTNSRDHAMDHHEMLHKVRTEGSISMTPEIFERLYLQPQTKVKGDLVKTFANPTPLAVGGFVVALTPLSCQLMNWRGSGQLGAATMSVSCDTAVDLRADLRQWCLLLHRRTMPVARGHPRILPR